MSPMGTRKWPRRTSSTCCKTFCHRCRATRFSGVPCVAFKALESRPQLRAILRQVNVESTGKLGLALGRGILRAS